MLLTIRGDLTLVLNAPLSRAPPPLRGDRRVRTSGAPATFSWSIPFLSLSSLFEYWMVCT